MFRKGSDTRGKYGLIGPWIIFFVASVVFRIRVVVLRVTEGYIRALSVAVP